MNMHCQFFSAHVYLFILLIFIRDSVCLVLVRSLQYLLWFDVCYFDSSIYLSVHYIVKLNM
jgi:hypothetical protein